MADLMICEICGKSFNSNGSDVCESCKKPVAKVKKGPATKIETALKRVMSGKVSRALDVRVCGCGIDRVISDLDDKNERLEEIEVNGIKVIVHEIKESFGMPAKTTVTYSQNGKVYSGFYA